MKKKASTNNIKMGVVKKVILLCFLTTAVGVLIWIIVSGPQGVSATSYSSTSMTPVNMPEINVPVLRQNVFSESEAMLDTSSVPVAEWTSDSKPQCNKNEFLLELDNLDGNSQINVFFSRGETEDKFILASGGPASKIYQCCPNYKSGMKLYYKYQGEDSKWYKYPSKLGKGESITIKSTDFEPTTI